MKSTRRTRRRLKRSRKRSKRPPGSGGARKRPPRTPRKSSRSTSSRSTRSARKSLISGSEEKGLASLESWETAQKDLEARRESFRELDERYATELARWESEKPGVARQVSDLKARIAELRGKLSKGVAAQFDRILERIPGGALAPVRLIQRPGKAQREWHCTACNYRVRPQSVVEIRNGTGLVQCDSCKRILYLEPAAEPDA